MPQVSRRVVLGAGVASLGLGIAGAAGLEAPAADAAPVGPPCRSDYLKSRGGVFLATWGRHTYHLKLAHIRDVAGATAAQRDQCFNLVFTAPAVLPDGIYRIARAGVPTQSLFLSRIGSGKTMQALVNRSVTP